MSELYHHGVKGMKWGVRRKKEKAHNSVKKHYDDYNDQFKKNRDSGIAAGKDPQERARDMWKTPSMQDFLKRPEVKKAYEERNKVYDGGDEDKIYEAGSKFEASMRKEIDNFFGKYANMPVGSMRSSTAKESVIRLIQRADWDNMNDYYHEWAWLYWH